MAGSTADPILLRSRARQGTEVKPLACTSPQRTDALLLAEGLNNQTIENEALQAVSAAVSGSGVSWEPEEAEVFDSGRFGYTRGTIESRSPGANGDTLITRSRYLTLWRKEADGRWRCFVEMTNQGVPVEQEQG